MWTLKIIHKATGWNDFAIKCVSTSFLHYLRFIYVCSRRACIARMVSENCHNLIYFGLVLSLVAFLFSFSSAYSSKLEKKTPHINLLIIWYSFILCIITYNLHGLIQTYCTILINFGSWISNWCHQRAQEPMLQHRISTLCQCVAHQAQYYTFATLLQCRPSMILCPFVFQYTIGVRLLKYWK